MKSAWLLRTDHARSSELVAEFLRQSAQAATTEEAFRHAGELLLQFFDADAVHLWQGEIERGRLRLLAGAGTDMQLLGDLGVEALPGFERASVQGEPLWVEDLSAHAQQLSAAFLEARSLLVLPAVVCGRILGCLFIFHLRKSASKPAPDELGAGLALVTALGLLLQTEAEKRRLRQLEEQHQAVARRKEKVYRAAWSQTGLSQLVAAVLELEQAVAAGLYECEANGLRRVAAAGSLELLPVELPRGETKTFSWEQALNRGQLLRVEPDEWAAAFPSGQASTSSPWLLLPLKGRGYPLGLLVLCGARAQSQDAGPHAELAELVFLATAALESRQLRSLNERDHRRYLQVFDQDEIGILFLSREGLVLDANRALLHLTGYAFHEVVPKVLSEFLHPADWQPLSDWLQHRSTPAFSRPVLWKSKAGAWQEWALSLRAAGPADYAGLVGFLRPTAQDSALAQRWRAAEIRLQAVLDSVHDGVWLISADGTVEGANQRLGQLLGVDARELGSGVAQLEVVDKLAGRFRAPEELRKRWRHLARYPEEVRWDELELVQPRRRILERFVRPLFDDQRRLTARLEVYRDITAQRLVEDKVLHRERLAALGQMVSGIAHELNNPLTAVSGYARLLLEGHPPRKLRAAASQLSSEAERASRIIKSLLLFGRVEQAEKRPVALPDLVDRIISLRAYELKLRNIEVQRRFARNLPAVLVDPHHLPQAILNLVLNAEQAIRSQRDHGRITFHLRSVDTDSVRLDISDDGPGISPAVLPHIFDPFFTTKSGSEGTGLGLSIVQSIVKEHGGEIRVQSTPGHGATFSLIFPAYQAEAEVEPPPTPQVVEAETLAGSPRVLVVDDEPSVAQLITDVLRRLGCRVRLHTDSNRALQVALREPFELIICDLRMPGLDGRAFHRILNERNPELARRLLFITGDTLAADTRAFLDQVQLPHIPKPFLVEELRAAVKEWFSRVGRVVVIPGAGKGRKVRAPGARKAGRRRTA